MSEEKALAKILRDRKVKIMPRTEDELIDRGIDPHGLPGTIERMKSNQISPKAVIVCLVADPLRPLVEPDNKTGDCAWGCGRRIQFRPWVPDANQKVCVFCVAERGVKDQ